MANWLTSLFAPKPEMGSIAALKVDLHSHLIPGIDDGVQNMDDAIHYILELKRLGYKKLITTPHIMPGYYDNNPAIILSGYNSLIEELKKRQIDIEIEVAAEYYFDDYLFDLLEKKQLMTFGNNYVLFELATINNPPRLKEFIFECNSNNIKPMLAHVERYNFMVDKNYRTYEDLYHMELFMQINIGTLAGAYGEPMQKMAYKLIEMGIIDFLGSDLHGEKHIEFLQKALMDKRFNVLLKNHVFKNTEL